MKKEGFTVTDYILKVCTISHHLATIGEPISQGDLIMHALARLSYNPCYNPFVTSINMMIVKPNLSAFYSQLETYQRMILKHFGIDKDHVFHAHITFRHRSFPY